MGEGLAAPLDSFDVTLVPGEAPRMLTLKGDAARAGRWFFRCFSPAPGYVGALAVERAVAGSECGNGVEQAAAVDDAGGAGRAWPVKTFRFS